MKKNHQSKEQSLPLLFSGTLPPILIIDPDCEFIRTILEDPEAKKAAPLCITSASEAHLLLARAKDHFSGIFINPAIEKPYAQSLIRSVHLSMPLVPMFFLYDQNTDPTQFAPPEELRNFGIQWSLRKPVSLAELLKILVPPPMIFDPKEAIQIAESNRDVVDEEVSAEDEAFFEVRAYSLISGLKSFFDIYVRLGKGRFVKILRAGESMDATRLQSYLSKGVIRFHIRNEAREHYVNYCDKLIAKVVEVSEIKPESKLAHVVIYGDELVGYLRGRGINSESIEYAKAYTGNVRGLIEQLDLKKHHFIRDFLTDLTAYDHGVAVTMIAALFVKAMNQKYGNSIFTVGLASMFHDIALDESIGDLHGESLTADSERDQFSLRSHPVAGAEMLKSTKGVHKVVCEAIEQHHERRDGTGFPAGNRESVNVTAQIVGIADEIFWLFKSQMRFKGMDPVGELVRRKILNGFSRPVEQAANSIFNLSQIS